ncbi:MAG: sulfurtransferase [Pelagibacteraceae bacterium]
MKIIKNLVILTITFLLSSQLASAESKFLVDTNWLAKNINNPKVKVIEVSVKPGVYEKGHIQGAVNFKWHTDLVDTVSRDIISKDKLQNLLRKSGVNKDSTIILYGDKNNWFAAWAAWVFDIYGVQNVKLLDGGRAKWEAEKKPLTPIASKVKSGNITLTKTNSALRARLSDVVAVAKKKSNVALVDIRSAAEYQGKVFAPAGVPELSVRAGHIPGAVNVGWGKAVNKDGTIKSASELKKIYAAAGIDGSKPIITYCRIGERSSHTWFVLKKVLGYDARNYDGSWTEYGNSVGNPITNLSGTVWGKI